MSTTSISSSNPTRTVDPLAVRPTTSSMHHRACITGGPVRAFMWPSCLERGACQVDLEPPPLLVAATRRSERHQRVINACQPMPQKKHTITVAAMKHPKLNARARRGEWCPSSVHT